MFYCVMYRSASVSPLKTEVNQLREGKHMFNFSSLVCFKMRHKYFYCNSSFLWFAVIYSLCKGSSTTWVYGDTWHRQNTSWKSVHYSFLHYHTLLTSSFLRISKLCHQETRNFFIMTTYPNKMMISILLDARINIENNLTFLLSLLFKL